MGSAGADEPIFGFCDIAGLAVCRVFLFQVPGPQAHPNGALAPQHLWAPGDVEHLGRQNIEKVIRVVVERKRVHDESDSICSRIVIKRNFFQPCAVKIIDKVLDQNWGIKEK